MSQILIQPEVKKMMQQELKPSQLLRTTKVTQTAVKFHEGNSFCALGAILHEKLGWNGNMDEFIITWKLTQLGIPLVVQNHVMRMNDDELRSFSQIADYLESVGL